MLTIRLEPTIENIPESSTLLSDYLRIEKVIDPQAGIEFVHPEREARVKLVPDFMLYVYGEVIAVEVTTKDKQGS